MRLRDRVLGGLRRRLGENGLPITLVFWDGDAYELGVAPQVTVALTKRALLPALLRGDIDALAAAYVRGDLALEGRLGDILAVGIALGQGKGGDNQRVRSGSTSETNERGVTTTQTSRGGEVKTEDGKGVVTTPGGETCARAADNQGCR